MIQTPVPASVLITLEIPEGITVDEIQVQSTSVVAQDESVPVTVSEARRVGVRRISRQLALHPRAQALSPIRSIAQRISELRRESEQSILPAMSDTTELQCEADSHSKDSDEDIPLAQFPRHRTIKRDRAALGPSSASLTRPDISHQ